MIRPSMPIPSPGNAKTFLPSTACQPVRGTMVTRSPSFLVLRYWVRNVRLGPVAIFRPRVASVAQSADTSPCKSLSETACSCSRLSPSFQHNSHAQLSLLGSLTRPTISNGAEIHRIFVRSFFPDLVTTFTDRPFSGSIVKGSACSASALRFTLSKISLASTKLSDICDPRLKQDFHFRRSACARDLWPQPLQPITDFDHLLIAEFAKSPSRGRFLERLD